MLGLVRQESRFIVDAKSSVGARGLMQLMPTTARWVAKRSGFSIFSMDRVAEVPVNVALGTNYLKMVLDDLGHPVLASAAYNAGPGRARRWRDHAAAGGRHLCRDHPVQRDARLRQEGDDELHVLLAADRR